IEHLGQKVHAEEQRDEDAHHADPREPEILDDAHLLVEAELAEHERERHDPDREQHEHREHAVAHRLAERVEADGPDAMQAAHEASLPCPAASCTNSSSSVWRCGVTCRISPPAAITAAMKACATSSLSLRITSPSL